MGGVLKPITKLLGGGSDLPTPAAAPAAPSISNPDVNNNAVQLAAEEEARKRNNAGRASTIFAGGSESGTPTGASRLFLGAGV